MRFAIFVPFVLQKLLFKYRNLNCWEVQWLSFQHSLVGPQFYNVIILRQLCHYLFTFSIDVYRMSICLQHTSATFGFSFATMVTRLDNFCRLGYFWKFIDFFVKPKNGDNLGNFLLKQFFIYFHWNNKQFQNMVCCTQLEVSKVVWCRYFGLSNCA